MGNNPSWFSSTGGGRDRVAGRSTGQLPVEQVNWFDAVMFCNALSNKDGLDAYYDIRGDQVRIRDTNHFGYRLPTEAEWEYACRAGKSTRYCFGDDPAKLDDFAWYKGNSNEGTHLVREKAPNDFGLFDVHGNVLEWCWDGWEKDYYRRSPAADPQGPPLVSIGVLRGGSWYFPPRFCWSAKRLRYPSAIRNYSMGLRVALNRQTEGAVRSAAAQPEQRQPPGAGQAPPLDVQKLRSSADRQSSSSRHEPLTWISPFSKIALVRIEGGEFLMGSPADDQDAEDGEKPQHKVRISTYFLGVTEVTQLQYQTVTGATQVGSHRQAAAKTKSQAALQASCRWSRFRGSTQ
jgi:formylglycine-generating enzyme required for sulfatase activity